MDILRHNFVANMYGPTFLVFYAVIIGAVLAMARWRTWAADRTQEERVESPPEPAEAIDLALLRGDVNEVLRLTVVELVQRGFLRVEERTFFGLGATGKIARAPGAPDVRYLSMLQRPVFDFFKEPKAAGLLFSDGSLVERVRAKCSDAERRLERYRLITPKEVQVRGYWTGFWAALLVLSLGGYKLQIALSKGKTNVGFLMAMGVVGAVAAVMAARAPRISRRGKAYIEKLQARYIRLKAGISGLTQTVDESALIFAVALFGMATLEGTAYQTLVPVFHKSTPSSGGCGGAGCGGGGCGGGGCGGGCGGCGGG